MCERSVGDGTPYCPRQKSVGMGSGRCSPPLMKVVDITNLRLPDTRKRPHKTTWHCHCGHGPCLFTATLSTEAWQQFHAVTTTPGRRPATCDASAAVHGPWRTRGTVARRDFAPFSWGPWQFVFEMSSAGPGLTFPGTTPNVFCVRVREIRALSELSLSKSSLSDCLIGSFCKSCQDTKLKRIRRVLLWLFLTLHWQFPV